MTHDVKLVYFLKCSLSDMLVSVEVRSGCVFLAKYGKRVLSWQLIRPILQEGECSSMLARG